MLDATTSCARMRDLAVWAAPGSAERPVGRPSDPSASRAQSGTDATSIGTGLIAHPRAASSRPETDDSWHQHLESPDEDPRRGAGGVRRTADGAGARPCRAEGGRGARPARRVRRLSHRPLHGLRRRSVRLRADGAGPRGRRGCRAPRRRRYLARARRPRRHALLAPVPGVHPLPQHAHEPLPRDPRRAGQGPPPGRDDAPLEGRRSDPPLHGDVDVRGVHGDARDRAGEDQQGRAARPRVPLRVWALDRDRGGDEDRGSRAGLDLRRLRCGNGRSRRGRRLPAAGRGADHLRRPLERPARAREGPGCDRDDDRQAQTWSIRSSS